MKAGALDIRHDPRWRPTQVSRSSQRCGNQAQHKGEGPGGRGRTSRR